jgi:type I site-specific restriction endonuclease
MDKKSLTETEIRTRYITPAIQSAGWPLDVMREEFFTLPTVALRLGVRHRYAKRLNM